MRGKQRPMSRSLLETMRRAMLPLDGSIAEHVPAILSAYARIVPIGRWPELTVLDLTAGSCLLSLLFAAQGARRVVVNDLAARTTLAARALFGGRTLDVNLVRQLVGTPKPRLRPHVPSFHFASDYLIEPVAGVFDRLFYAALPPAESHIYRYLALRWILGFAPSAEDPFAVLPTHAEDQLRDDLDHDWAPYLRRVRQRDSVLTLLARDLNAAVRRVATARVEIHQADVRVLCRQLDWRRPVFVMINPPTRGLDEYVVDDQLAHSLLANRWLPLSRSRETAAALWTECVEAVLRRLARGSHAVVWGGDGDMTWRQCWQVWTRFAEPVVIHPVERGRRRVGWAILEKR